MTSDRMPDGSMSANFTHSGKARARTYLYPGRPPIIAVDQDVMSVMVSPDVQGLAGEDYGHFARELAAAADQYAWDMARFVGDPQAGADFWSSIDTCPDESCGGGS